MNKQEYSINSQLIDVVECVVNCGKNPHKSNFLTISFWICYFGNRFFFQTTDK